MYNLNLNCKVTNVSFKVWIAVMISHSVYFCLYLSEYSLQYRLGNASRHISNSCILQHLGEIGIFFEEVQLVNQKWSSDYLDVEIQPAALPWFILVINKQYFKKESLWNEVFYTFILKTLSYWSSCSCCCWHMLYIKYQNRINVTLI